MTQPFGPRLVTDHGMHPTLTPRLAEILAGMVEAVLDAEDAAFATGGTIAARGEAGSRRLVTPVRLKSLPAKEAAS